LFNFTISLSLIFNQYVNPIALQNIGWKYYTVYIAWLSFELVFIWMYLVETKNRTLEETAAIFDGEDEVAMIEKQGRNQIEGENSSDAHVESMDEKEKI